MLADGPFVGATIPHATTAAVSGPEPDTRSMPSAYARGDAAAHPLHAPVAPGSDRLHVAPAPRRATAHRGRARVTDLLAIVASALGAVALTWAAHEVRGYLARRRRHGAPRAPGYLRMRIALYAGLTTVGAILGLALGAWIAR